MRKFTQRFKPPSLVEIRRNRKYGKRSRAVHATRDIKRGRIIESCPVIRMYADDVYDDENRSLPTISWYCFHWHEGDGLDYTALALGYGSLYNHSNAPNAKFEYVNRDCLRFRALRDIKKGEEITIHYQQHDKTIEVEFSKTGISQ